MVAGFAAAAALTAAEPAGAVQVALTSTPTIVPASTTPQINDGAVYSIAQVHSDMIVGGTFSSVSPPAGTPATKHPYVVAFNASTGAIDAGFAPTINGVVNVVAAGPKPNEVYVGGDFTTVDGRSLRLALLNLTNGAIVAGWKPSAMDGTVNDVVLSRGQLFVGGGFTHVGGFPHGGLVVLSPQTGQVTSYANLSFTGHHNYGRNCDPTSDPLCVSARVGIKALDVNPAGTRLIAIGNFTHVGGLPRDQIALIALGSKAASVDAHWATQAYTATCLDHSFDSYVRDVQFSPDGRSFVVVASGGVGTGSASTVDNTDGTVPSCDAAASWQTSATGADVRPTWVDYTGEDSLLSVSVTDAAVYVGGHQRWMNNSQGLDAAKEGAVPRPGLAALSPASGLPLLWNPGRNPRGAGAYALLATAKGLWVGSDTTYIGDNNSTRYLRPRIAFFPLTGGLAESADATPQLPGQVYLVGATTSGTVRGTDGLGDREFDGSYAAPDHPVSTSVAWGSVDGAFTVDGELVYGKSDGNLYERTFNGSTLGPEVELDPWNDPVWDNVKTGSGPTGQTYQGMPSSFTAEIPELTSMFFVNGRLYYTQSGVSAMHWRWYQPQSGVVGADEFTVADGKSWTGVAGAFLSGSRLYFARQSDGDLYSIAFTGGKATGTASLVSSTGDWASRGLFALSQADAPTAKPVAAMTASCGTSATCSFHATPWTDPAGGQVRYAWSFGDGTSTVASLAATARHTYRRNGPHAVTVTVTDTAGARATSHLSVKVAAPVAKIRYVASSVGTARARTVHVRVPARAAAHDALLMFASYRAAKVDAAPKGWTLIGRNHRGTLTTAAYVKVATSHDARRLLTFRFARSEPASLTVLAYAGASPQPIDAKATTTAGAARLHRAPRVAGLVAGSWVVSEWVETAARSLRWTAPHGTSHRASGLVHGPPVLASLSVDSTRARAGAVSLGVARSSRVSRAVVAWTVGLAPALR